MDCAYFDWRLLRSWFPQARLVLKRAWKYWRVWVVFFWVMPDQAFSVLPVEWDSGRAWMFQGLSCSSLRRLPAWHDAWFGPVEQSTSWFYLHGSEKTAFQMTLWLTCDLILLSISLVGPGAGPSMSMGLSCFSRERLFWMRGSRCWWRWGCKMLGRFWSG